MWYVMCRVSGGVTGTREALLKRSDGAVREFETREAAEAEARRWNDHPRSPYSTADFRYWVVGE